MPLPTIDDCRIIQLPKIPDYRGNLTYIEGGRHVPFRIARTYWIYDVPGDTVRGGHAYHQLEELIVALSGSFEVRLDDGSSKKTFVMKRSFYGLYVPNAIWRELGDFSTNAVCVILASRQFAESDYIYDFDRFRRMRREEPC